MRLILRLSLVFILICIYCAPSYALTEVRSTPGNMHVNSIAQDNRGYIWIATAKGLCRYNGYEYVIYYHSDQDPCSLPSDMVRQLHVDRNGCLWIGTDKGYCRYDHFRDKFITGSYTDPGELPSYIHGFLEDKNKLLMFGMNGIKVVDRDNMTCRNVAASRDMVVSTMIATESGGYLIGTSFGQGLYHADSNLESFTLLHDDSQLEYNCSYRPPHTGDYWLGTNKGIQRCRKTENDGWECSFIRGSSMLPVTFLHPADTNEPYDFGDSKILVGTDNRGLYYAVDSDRGITFDREKELFPGLKAVHLTTAFSDLDGNIWIGTFDKGYQVAYAMPYSFNDDAALNDLVEGRFVTRIAQEASGNLWLGTRYYGLMSYDIDTGSVKVFDKTNFPPFREANNDFIQSLLIDSRGDVWAGYDKYLLWMRPGKTPSYRIFSTQADVVCLEEDSYGKIWAGTSSNGILIYDPAAGWEVGRIHPEQWSNITKILSLRSGEIIFSFYDRGIFLAEPGTLEIRRMAIPEEFSVHSHRIISICEDDRSNLWFGTYGNGVVKYNKKEETFTHFGPENGLAGNDVLCILQDDNGDIWMSTASGLSVYNNRTGKFRNFYEYDGTGGDQFHEKAGLISHGGRLFFGGNHGLTYFRPEDLSAGNRKVNVVLENLLIMNRSAEIGGRGDVLQEHISYTGKIILDHRQNVFSIDYVGIDYGSSHKLRYAYRLQGFDRDWNYVDHHRRASYSNLSPGRYVFEVMAQNSDGAWSDSPATLEIVVKAAPWLTPVALLLYTLLTLTAIYAGLRIYIRVNMDRERLDLVQRERKYEQEMNDMKIRFFANISHELRTPLSMVYGPVKKLRTGTAAESEKPYLLGLAEYNSEKLLRLADQLMDFSKLENDTLGLSVEPVDIRRFLKETAHIFGYYAREKGIRLDMDFEETDTEVYIDPDKIDKITANLLSNAVKYTPEGGNVHLSASVTGEGESRTLTLEVRDNGIGMKDEDLDKLFTRYKRFADRYSAKTTGKGIGLNYSKRLAEMHKGSLSARKGEGGGMIFTLTVPAASQAYGPDERAADKTALPLNGQYAKQPPEAAPSVSRDKTTRTGPRPTLLIVEDNEELLSFLASLLSSRYRVLAAPDGVKGLEICRKVAVDLVLSDVLMPNMNGYQLCSAIKEDKELSHIPVVLLTAKTLDEDHLKGYTSGADAYMNKPFNPEVLIALIENVFNNIRRRQQRISGIASNEYEADSGESSKEKEYVSPLDARFLEKLYERLDSDLANSSLNINILSREMGFSRTSFYRKIKSLTGYAPNDFLRVYRLQKAAALLRTRRYSVNEIVDMTGFGTHSHFSLCFKKQFGVTPKDYMKSGGTT